MKIKSFLLLGLATIFSMNAFATAGDDFKKDGIVYNVLNDAARTVEVKGVFDGTYTSINIPATVANGGITWAVTGFAASWSSAQTAASPEIATEAVTATKMTVDVSNFTASPGLTIPNSVTELIVKGTSQNDFTIPDGSALEKLDASELGAASGKTLKLGLANKNSHIKEVALNADITGVDLWNSPALEKVTGIKTIATGCLADCASLTQVTLATGATLGDNAFKNSAKLATVNMGVATEIGENAFTGTAITSIDLSAAKTIKAGAFSGLGITTLTIPAQVENIAKGAFAGMAKLATVTINIDNDKCTKIDQWFAQAPGGAITSLTINTPKVTELLVNAFAWEPIATLSITAPKLTTIGQDAFYSYAGTTVNLNSLEALATFTDATGTTFKPNAYTEVQLGKTKLTAVPACFTKGSAASLTKLGLPANMTTLSGLNGLTALKALDLPKNLTTIAASACEGMTSLESIVIPAKVEMIYGKAFNGCTALASVDFSKATALKEINSDAFAGTKITTLDLSACAELYYVSGSAFPQNEYTSVLLSGTKLPYTDGGGVYHDYFAGDGTQYFAKILTNSKKSLKEITLPAGLKAITSNMFKQFEALESVSLPKTVTTIGASAFEASGLTAFKVRENVATIGKAAFKDCKALAIVNFSEATALSTIDDNAFQNTAIKEVAIPANAEDKTLAIGVAAFEGCAKLKSFSAKSWANALADNLFKDCVKMTGIVIPATITSIGANAFQGGEALATVTFKYSEKDAALSGTGVKVGANAFDGCKALASLDLSTTKLAGLTAANIFKGCTSLAEITFPETMTTLTTSLADCAIEDLDASMVTTCGVTLFAATSTNPNTTLKSVIIGSSAAGTIPTNCFAYCTALEEVTVIAAASPASGTVAKNAFDHCTALTTFTYEPKAALGATVKPVDNDAFVGCIPFVEFVTNNFYWDANPVPPMNATYGTDEITVVKTVQDKANENQFFAKYYNTALNVEFDADECKLFTVYVDGETAYFQACRTYEGKYYIPAKREVIVKTSEAKEVNFKPCVFPASVPGTGSIGWDDMYCSQPGDDLAAVQAGVGLTAGKYLYRLTNTAEIGFGFTYFSGTTIKEGQFFIGCAKKPAGAGRLNIVWLDEDGNVIDGEATAIQNVKSLDQNDGAIYNLQGVRVQKAQKGIYIQNGKKIFVK